MEFGMHVYVKYANLSVDLFLRIGVITCFWYKFVVKSLCSLPLYAHINHCIFHNEIFDYRVDATILKCPLARHSSSCYRSMHVATSVALARRRRHWLWLAIVSHIEHAGEHKA